MMKRRGLQSTYPTPLLLNSSNKIKYKETLFFSFTKVLLFFVFVFLFVCVFKLLISGQVRSVFVLKRIFMEVALSLSWLLLGLACTLISVNKLKIKLETKNWNSRRRQQARQPGSPCNRHGAAASSHYVQSPSYIPLSPKHTPCSNGLAAAEGVSFSSQRPVQQLPRRETAPSQECQAEG